MLFEHVRWLGVQLLFSLQQNYQALQKHIFSQLQIIGIVVGKTEAEQSTTQANPELEEEC